MKSFQLICMWLLLLITTATVAFRQREEWVEPHAWGEGRRLSSLKTANEPNNECNCPGDANNPEIPIACPVRAECICPKTTAKTDEHSEFLYRKLVKYIFNVRNVKMNVESDQYHRNLHLVITREQYERLTGAIDLREIDGIVSDVLEQSSRASTMDLVLEVVHSWSESVTRAWYAIISNRWLMNAFTLSAFAIALYICRRLNINVFVVVVFVISFFTYQYLDAECQRNLEIEQVATLLQGDQTDPCKTRHASFWIYAFSSPKEECRRYLGETYDRKCTIKDIYNGFFEVFVYGQMSLFLENIAGITSKINSKYGILATIIITALLYANLGIITSAFFKYILAPFIHRSTSDAASSNTSTEGTSDRLSGPNIDRLLSITENHARNQAKLLKVLSKQKIKSETSGVQVVLGTDSTAEPISDTNEVNKTSTLNTVSETNVVSEIPKAKQSKIEDTAHSSEGDSSAYDTDDDIVILKHHCD